MDHFIGMGTRTFVRLHFAPCPRVSIAFFLFRHCVYTLWRPIIDLVATRPFTFVSHARYPSPFLFRRNRDLR